MTTLTRSVLATLIAVTAGLATQVNAQVTSAPETARTARKPQQVCLPETDPTSLRHTRLTRNNTSSTEIIRMDVDHDGDPDILERWWNGKRVRWFDENDNMRADDTAGDIANDSLQIDRDGDGYYDGPGDMNVKWVDDDGDGHAELQMVGMNPSREQLSPGGGESHYMIFEDVDRDNVFGCIDWNTFKFECWKLRPEGTPNFQPDYNGDSIFLKEHLAPWMIQDPRYNWENPFAFYDMDGDGVTEMAIRFCDNKERVPGTTEGAEGSWRYDGKIDEAYVTYDLDNDTGRGNEMDYDMTLRFSGGEKLDYSSFHHPHANIKAPDWVLPYYRYTNWRKIDELIYVPHEKCYDEIWKPRWGSCWLVFDEDDDDHRWERVELYYPEDRQKRKSDPWNPLKWRGGGYAPSEQDRATTGGMSGHPQADTLGDRGEWDLDNSGRGQLYVGRWDKKIHLYGAEEGAWTVDYGGKFWGAGPNVPGNSSKERAQKVDEVVLYKDTDGNGFFDEIDYDYDGDRTIDLRAFLPEIYKADGSASGEENADVAELIDPHALGWAGLHKLYNQLSNESWDEAQLLYRAAWRKGLNDSELDALAVASSVAEKSDHAYWLKEKLFRKLDRMLSTKPNLAKCREQLRRQYFLGDIKSLAQLIAENEW